MTRCPIGNDVVWPHSQPPKFSLGKPASMFIADWSGNNIDM
jgi:hypothetical protein